MIIDWENITVTQDAPETPDFSLSFDSDEPWYDDEPNDIEIDDDDDEVLFDDDDDSVSDSESDWADFVMNVYDEVLDDYVDYYTNDL